MTENKQIIIDAQGCHKCIYSKMNGMEQTTDNAYNYLVKLARYRLDKIEDLQQQLDQLKVAKEQAEQKFKQIEKLCIKKSTISSFCNGIENKDMQKLAIRILQIISEVK